MYEKYTNERNSLSPEEIDAMSRFISECGLFIDKCVKAGILRVTSPPESIVPCDTSIPNSDHENGGNSVSDTQRTDISIEGTELTDEGVSETSDTTSERITRTLVESIYFLQSRLMLVQFRSVRVSSVRLS